MTRTPTDPQPDEIVIRVPGRWLRPLLVATLAVWLLLNAGRVVGVLSVALLLAVAIAPPVRALARRGVPRGVAIGSIYLALLLAVGSLIGLLVPLVGQEATVLATRGPAMAGQVVQTVSRLLPAAISQRVVAALDLQSLAGQGLSTVGQLLTSVTTVLLTVGQTAVLGVVVLAMAYFMVADERLIDRLVVRYIPEARRDRVRALGARLAQQLGRWVRAQALISLYYGVTFALALVLLGVPYAFTLGTIGALLEVIPYLGGITATALAMLVALTVDPLRALLVLLAHLVIANIEAHALTPTLLGNRLGLHPLAVVVALFLGAELIGLLGVLLAVPLLAVVQVLAEFSDLTA